MRKVLILTDGEFSAISDALQRILADSPDIAFGSYSKREQVVKWCNVENAETALTNAQDLKPNERICILTKSETSNICLAAGNILQASDTKEIRDFFGNNAAVSAAWRGFDKLYNLFK